MIFSPAVTIPRRLVVLVAAATAFTAIQAQTAPAPSFEVASIKVRTMSSGASGIKTGHGRLDAENVSVARCIIGAFGVGPHQIVGGPDWIDSERFDMFAKAELPVNDDAALMKMLQTLLVERFGLLLHREMKTMSAFALETAKSGPRLERVESGDAGTNTSNSNNGITVTAHHTGMDSLARTLGRQLRVPIVNRTGID